MRMHLTEAETETLERALANGGEVRSPPLHPNAAAAVLRNLKRNHLVKVRTGCRFGLELTPLGRKYASGEL